MTASPDPAPEFATTPPRRTKPWMIALAVAVVAVPLAWGISQTVLKSKSLFHHGPTAKVSSTKPTKGGKSASPTTDPTTTATTHAAKSAKHKK